MTDRWKARSLLLGLTAAVTLPAAASAQTPTAPPVSPASGSATPATCIGRAARRGAAAGAPPPTGSRRRPSRPRAARPSAAAAARGPVPGNVPTTWGPTEPEEAVVEAASRGPIARPRLSGAVGMGSSYDSVGFRAARRRSRRFVGVLGIGDGLLGPGPGRVRDVRHARAAPGGQPGRSAGGGPLRCRAAGRPAPARRSQLRACASSIRSPPSWASVWNGPDAATSRAPGS